MSNSLFVYLNEVGALFPEKDDSYDAELEKQYLESVVNERLPELERQRMEVLSKDYKPNKNWWGSKISID